MASAAVVTESEPCVVVLLLYWSLFSTVQLKALVTSPSATWVMVAVTAGVIVTTSPVESVAVPVVAGAVMVTG